MDNIDDEDYLGQPMISVGLQKDYGRFVACLFPGSEKEPFLDGMGDFVAL